MITQAVLDRRKRAGMMGTSEIAETLGVTPQTIRAWIKTGQLRGTRLGGRFYTTMTEIDRLVKRLNGEDDASP